MGFLFKQPMLAETVDLDKLEFPVLAQPKYDGFRCTNVPDKGPVTRTLKPIPNHYIREALSDPALKFFDGEIVTYTNGIADTLDVVQSKVTTAAGEPHFTFHVFDHIENMDDTYENRLLRVTGFFGASVIPVPTVKIKTMADLMAYEEELVSNGWEGVILRKPGSRYKMGRSTVKEGILLKMKRFYDSEAEIVGYVEKMRNMNEQTRDERGYAKRSSAKDGKVPADTLGALVCRWHTGIEFEIGTGFDSEMADKIWRNRPRYLGGKVTFKYQRVGPNGKPVLPVFKMIRSEIDIVSDKPRRDYSEFV